MPTIDAGQQTTAFYNLVEIGEYVYSGPTTIIQLAAATTFLGGLPNSPTSPCGNCTYTSTFFAPAWS